MMQESPFIEHLIQKYSEQGARENVINNDSVCANRTVSAEQFAIRSTGT